MPKFTRKLIQRTACVGLSYHNYGLHAKEIQVGDRLILENDPENKFDKTAVKVLYEAPDGSVDQIGWLPKGNNEVIFNLIKSGVELTTAVLSYDPTAPLQTRLFIGTYITIVE